MNENEGIMEQLEDNMESDGNELPALENGENVEEGYDGNQSSEETGEDTILTVSDGDSETLSLILAELQNQSVKMEEMQTYQAERDLSLFDKTFSKYTTGEGMLLIILLISLTYLVFHWVGGILRCEM